MKPSRNFRIKINDPWLLWLALIATGLGLFFIFDAGYARSLRDGKGPIPREFLYQCLYLPFAALAFYVAARVKAEQWLRWSKLLWVATLVALALCMVPKIGVNLNGAHRWIKVGPVNLQPAELAKVTAILYLAGVFAARKAWPKKVKAPKNFAMRLDSIAIPKLKRAMPLIWVLVGAVLIEIEPDLGTAAVIGFTAFAMMFIGGVTRKSLLWSIALLAIGVTAVVIKEPYRLERITMHTSRWSQENMDETGFQTVQAETGMASGGLFGAGLGNGRTKHVLPATTTDFIMATVAEELGLVGSLIVLGVLSALVWRMLSKAREVKDPFARMVLGGVAAWFGIQTCVNVMMANGSLPAIGIPLPFISSGGSSLVSLWFALGLCQSVLRPKAALKIEEGHALTDHRWRDGRAHLSRA